MTTTEYTLDELIIQGERAHRREQAARRLCIMRDQKLAEAQSLSAEATDLLIDAEKERQRIAAELVAALAKFKDESGI